MRLFRQLAALALLLAAASPALADIALPKRPGADNNEIRRDLPAARMTTFKLLAVEDSCDAPRNTVDE